MGWSVGCTSMISLLYRTTQFCHQFTDQLAINLLINLPSIYRQVRSFQTKSPFYRPVFGKVGVSHPITTPSSPQTTPPCVLTTYFSGVICLILDNTAVTFGISCLYAPAVINWSPHHEEINEKNFFFYIVIYTRLLVKEISTTFILLSSVSIQLLYGCNCNVRFNRNCEMHCYA